MKEELATMIVNFFHLSKLAKDHRFFRQYLKHVERIQSLVDRAIEWVKNIKEEDSEPKLLRGEKRTSIQLGRGYCKGGGFKSQDEFLHYCVFCKHQFADEIPENLNVMENNRKKEKTHNELKIKLDDFKNGLSTEPPIGPNGKPITKRLPAMKKESLIIQCHCYQMSCVQEGTDVGSTCKMNCCNSKTGERYPWKLLNKTTKCTCPVCLCMCRKAYKVDNLAGIMTEWQKQILSILVTAKKKKKSAKMRKEILFQKPLILGLNNVPYTNQCLRIRKIIVSTFDF